LHGAPIGYFGASTGSAAALIAAARLGDRIAAVVSRGGRPDLAGPAALAAVKAPTLLIVGGADRGVIELNEAAFERLRCDKELVVVPGATHLFEEPGALDAVSQAAARWFCAHFATLHEGAS
jgi:pimeloyl-ACP methyl ester carboxylesterase